MLTHSAKVIIAILSLVIMSSAVIQTSYSQQPTSNSSLGSTMISNNSQTDSTPNVMKYEAAREQFLKSWDQLEFEPRVATFVNESEVIGTSIFTPFSDSSAR